jgi:hypothetical protein
VYFGLLIIDEPTRDKLNRKHNITYNDVVEAIQHPARAEARYLLPGTGP